MLHYQGRNASRPYEAIGEAIQSVTARINLRKHQDMQSSEFIHTRFKILMEDFKAGHICVSTLRDFLRMLQSFFNNEPQFAFPEHHKAEILAAIKEHC